MQLSSLIHHHHFHPLYFQKRKNVKPTAKPKPSHQSPLSIQKYYLTTYYEHLSKVHILHLTNYYNNSDLYETLSKISPVYSSTVFDLNIIFSLSTHSSHGKRKKIHRKKSNLHTRKTTFIIIKPLPLLTKVQVK